MFIDDVFLQGLREARKRKEGTKSRKAVINPDKSRLRKRCGDLWMIDKSSNTVIAAKLKSARIRLRHWILHGVHSGSLSYRLVL